MVVADALHRADSICGGSEKLTLKFTIYIRLVKEPEAVLVVTRKLRAATTERRQAWEYGCPLDQTFPGRNFTGHRYFFTSRLLRISGATINNW